MSFTKMLEKISKADPAGGGNKLRDGAGVIVVERIVAREGHKGTSVRFEGVVESSKKVTVVSPKSQQTLDVAPNDPGSSVSVVDNLKNTGAEGRILDIILKLFNEDSNAPESKRTELLACIQEEGDSTPNLARGLAIAYETDRIVTKNGVEMSAPRWSAITQTEDDILRRQKMLNERR